MRGLAVALAVAAALPAMAAPPTGGSVDDLIARHIAARGGLAAIKAAIAG